MARQVEFIREATAGETCSNGDNQPAIAVFRIRKSGQFEEMSKKVCSGCCAPLLAEAQANEGSIFRY